MAHQDSLRQFQEIQAVVARYGTIFANIKPPQVVYEEEKQSLRIQVRAALTSLCGAETEEETSTYEDNVIHLNGQIKKLENLYATNSDQYVREYEARLRETMDNLRDRLAHILALTSPTQNQTPIIQKAGEQGPPDQHQDKVSPDVETHETEAAKSSHASQDIRIKIGTDLTTNESLKRDAPRNEVVEAIPEPEDAIDQGPTFDNQEDHHVDNDKTNDDAVNGDENADIEMPDAHQPIEAGPTKPGNELPEKFVANITPASGNLQTAPLSPVSTCDDDITARRGTAQRHRSSGSMNAPPQNIPPSKSKETLSKKRKASTPVSGTDKRHRTDLTSSTGSPQKITTEQPCQTTTETSRTSTTERSNKPSMPAVVEPAERVLRRSHRHIEESTDNDKFEGILNPKPGNIYTTYWKKTKEWLAVVLLPMGDFSTVGIPGSIVSCDLIETLPPCYNKIPKRGKYVWAKGYRNREAHEKERMFPVMFFDGRPFPGKSAIMWIEARELRDFDPKQKHRLIPYLKTVRGYLQSREWSEDEDEDDSDEGSEEEEEVEEDEGETPEEDEGGDAERDESGTRGYDEGGTGEDERTREDSVWQEDPEPESSQQTDAEEQETLPTEEDTEILNHATEEGESRNIQPRSHQKHSKQKDVETQGSADELTEPSLPDHHETPNAKAQIDEPLPEFESEELASLVNDIPSQPRNQQESQQQDQSQSRSASSDLPQHQKKHLLQSHFPNSFWPTVSAALPTLTSVAPRPDLDRRQELHHVPLPALVTGDSTQRPGSLTVSTEPETQDSALHPLQDPGAEGVKRNPCITSDTFITDSDASVKRPSRSQLPSSQAPTLQNPDLRHYLPFSSCPAQAAHQIINSRLKDTLPQQPGPHQEDSNEFHNDHTTKSFHSSSHPRPMPVETCPQPQYSAQKDTNDAYATQSLSAIDPGSRAVMEVIPPRQPQVPTPLPAQNPVSYAVVVPPQQLERQPVQPQEPRAISDNTHVSAQSMRQLYQNINLPTRTDDESSQEQRQSLSDNQPAPPAVIESYHKYRMPALNDEFQQQRDALQAEYERSRQFDTQDEQMYAERCHLDPSHPCFHPRRSKIVIHGNYFPESLQRYLHNYKPMSGSSPGWAVFGFQTSDGKGYWCPFCTEYEKHGSRSHLQVVETYKVFRCFKQHLVKHWLGSTGPITKMNGQ